MLKKMVLIIIWGAIIPSFSQAVVSAKANEKTEWWEDSVFYEIFVRSFLDSDADGIGDLQGLIQKLDYLNDGNPQTQTDLGINGIWLMPIMESPSYHGYDCVDYFNVEKDYGNNALFKQLIQECHKRGIKVILDLMLNHTSNQHPWFQAASSDKQSPYRDWYIWSDANPGYLGPWGETVWHQSGQSYYFGIFWSGMPDLNYRNPLVTTEMNTVTRFWLEDMGADGLRLDAIRHLIENGSIMTDTDATHSWLTQYNQNLDRYAPNALTVGEIWSDTMDVVPYIKDHELDLAFEFQIADSIIQSINASKPTQWMDALQFAFDEYPPLQFATFITNHDQNRVMTQFGGDSDKAKLAATLLLTMPGTPFIYYGEEIGMTGAKPDELIRTPMQWDNSTQGGFTQGTPWESLNSDVQQRNVASQQGDPDSLWSTYRDLIHLRREKPVLRRGDLHFLSTSSAAVGSFIRRSVLGNQGLKLISNPILVILNFNYREMSSIAIHSEDTLLKPGTYTLKSLRGNLDIGQIVIQDDGRIPSFTPAQSLPARSGTIVELIREIHPQSP